MFKLIFRSTVRSILKYKNISLVNIFGLIIGITAFLFSVQYLLYEFSFDSFFPDSQQIYRVNLDIEKNNQKIYEGAKTPRGLYDALRDELPEVQANGIAYIEKCLVNFESTTYVNQDVLWVDDGFEDVFPLEMVEGVADYSRPRAGIISETAAKALFGNQNPIGKIMGVNQGMPIEITGIFKDLPSNTHLNASYFASIKTWVEMEAITEVGDWQWNGWWNYVKLKNGSSAKTVEDKINILAESHMSHLTEDDRQGHFSLQPVKDLHYISDLEGTMGATTNRNSLVNLLVIALVTLIIAYMNYVNLSIAHAQTQAMQNGMRKLFGATKFHQWLQTFCESSIINLAAIFVSAILFFIFRNMFATTFNIPLSQSNMPFSLIILILLGTVFTGILFSSFYHGIQLARISFLKEQGAIKKGQFKTGLVVTQMALSIIFLTCTFLVYKQISFMKSKDLGIALNDVIICNAPASLNADGKKRQRFEGFKSELLSFAAFRSANFNLFTPGQSPQYGFSEFTNPMAKDKSDVQFFMNQAGNGFLETFQLKLLAGKGFSEKPEENTDKIIINKLSMELLGISSAQDAIGKNVYQKVPDSPPLEIIGVVDNFHNEGLQKAIYPIVWNNNFPSEFGYFSIGLATHNLQQSIDQLRELWEKHYPKDQLNYVFANDQFNKQYESEQRFSKFYLWLTFLSIGIATIGLFALTIFYLEKRNKEIGIRKVNGAKIHEILTLINKDFVRWVFFAFVIACPVAWYAMHKWLNNFAYRTEISWWIFALAGLIAMLIAVLTVSIQSIKTASRNPVEALRYE